MRTPPSRTRSRWVATGATPTPWGRCRRRSQLPCGGSKPTRRSSTTTEVGRSAVKTGIHTAVAARSIWNGTISLGTIAVPIKVHSATESKGVRFNEVHESDGARIEHKRICPQTGRRCPTTRSSRATRSPRVSTSCSRRRRSPPPPASAAACSRSRSSSTPTEIDPVVYDRTYYLGVRDADDAYRCCMPRWTAAGRAGIARWVFHNREYLVAIRSHRRRAGDAHDALPRRARRPGGARHRRAVAQAQRQEVEMAARSSRRCTTDFEPEMLADTYREHVLDYLEARSARARRPSRRRPSRPRPPTT